MRHHPRGLSSELRDEYISALAPEPELFQDFRGALEGRGHNEAFEAVDYEERFWLSEKGIGELKRITDASQSEDVHLVCQCRIGQKCHRELLMIWASLAFRARIDETFHD